MTLNLSTRRVWPFAFAAILFFAACSEDTITTNQSEPIGYTINEYLLTEVFQKYYLWPDQITQADVQSTSEPAEYIDLVKAPNDQLSAVIDSLLFYQLFDAGRMQGFGFFAVPDNSGKLRVAYVEPNSSASTDTVALMRGDIITSVDSAQLSQVTAKDYWRQVMGTNIVSNFTGLRVQGADGGMSAVNVQKQFFNLSPVWFADTANSNENYRYLLMPHIFADTQVAVLDSIFGEFKTQGVSELIIDLRYTMGGKASVARHLANLMLGVDHDGQVWSKSYYNSSYERYNETITEHIEAQANSISLNRIVVICSGLTAATAEFFINNLKAVHSDVYLVGQQTYGRPYKLADFPYLGKAIVAVVAETENRNGQKVAASGIAPDEVCADDFGHELGSKVETCLLRAILHLN